MVEDTTVCAPSPAHSPGKKSSEDLDHSFCPIELKETNHTDHSSFPINKESGLNKNEGEDIYSSVTNGPVHQVVFKATETDGSVVYRVSPSSMDEEHLKNYDNGSVKHSEGPQALIIDKECDHSAVKDIWVDERVSSETAKYESTQVRESEDPPEISSRRVVHRADANDSLDFETLLDQAEVENNVLRGISVDIVDKTFLDELLASANNPFLEDLHVKTCREGEQEAVSVAHHSNPLNFEGTLDETEANCGVEETSDKVEFSAKNPFLDTSSFKAAKDDCKETVKNSGNDVAVDGVVDKEPATLGEEKKTSNDVTAEAPNKSSTVESVTSGANDKMKDPELVDNQANAKQLQHDPMESSFASMNPYPALVSYSGQIPFSGSMSLRSESSATSNRSFAFPVLQTEWNTSPVKMAKANRKHHSWRHTLLCCNF